MLNKPISSSGKIWFQSPNKFRREAKGNSPSITVSDGQHLWIYYPKFQSAEHYSLGKRSPLDAGIAAITASLNLENVEATYHMTGTKEADGYQLQLTAAQSLDETVPANLQHPHEQRIAGRAHGDGATERRPDRYDLLERNARADFSIDV